LINQKFKIEGRYTEGENTATDYKSINIDGTYTATEIVKQLGDGTANFMRDTFSKEGFTVLYQYTEVNLERFYINFLVEFHKDIGFHFFTNLGPIIANIFNFESVFQTSTTIEDSDYMRVVIDIDLSAISYPKLDDRISRLLTSMQLSIDTLEQAVDPAYRYLAFYGEALQSSNSKPTFHELELDLKDGTWIGWGSMEGIIQPPVQTFAWDYWAGHDNLSDVFDGYKAYGDNPRLQFLFENYAYNDRKRVIFYFDCTTMRRVKSGTYWTYPDTINSFNNGKIPSLLSDPSRIPEWEYVCDLQGIGMG